MTLTAPIIGITTSHATSSSGLNTISLTEAYVTAVLRAGGIPVLLPVGLTSSHMAHLRPHLQAILFSGGGDIDPVLFNGVPHPRVNEIDVLRDTLEIELVQQAAQEGFPFLGICRGIQVINVALGGTLYTDIGDQLPGALRHDWYPNIPRDHLAHAVRVEKSSRLHAILGSETVQANSLHHQGLKDLAPSLTPTAYSPDGLVEAVELPGHPFGLGVQWHPEWLPDLEPMQAIFRALVRAAENGK